MNGDQVAEFDPSDNARHANVFADGRLLETFVGSLRYFAFNDWLGTKRAQITSDGNTTSLLTFASLPFGDGLTNIGGNATEQHFTGKERDNESQNEYFDARYYSSGKGRFLSPDWSAKATPVPYAVLGNPQSLNLYAYVGNNPLSLADSTGHDWVLDFFTRNTSSIQNSVFQQDQLPTMLKLQHQLEDQQHHALAGELADEAKHAGLTVNGYGKTPYTAQYIYDNTTFVQTVGGNSDFFPGSYYDPTKKNSNDSGMDTLLTGLGLKSPDHPLGCESPCRSGGLENSPHYHDGLVHMDGFNLDMGIEVKILHSVVDYIYGSAIMDTYPFSRPVQP